MHEETLTDAARCHRSTPSCVEAWINRRQQSSSGNSMKGIEDNKAQSGCHRMLLFVRRHTARTLDQNI